MSRFTGRTIAVFGGSGFIGRSVVARLIADGATVRIATRNPVDPGQLLYRRGDAATIEPILAGADGVVHLIGILAEHGAEDFFTVQRDGPAVIAVMARAAGIKDFVHVSAIGADPASPARYGRSKAAGETAVRFAFPDAVILRPSIVIGKGDGFFTLFSKIAKYSPVLPLIGGGKTKFQPVYVGDVAAAVAESLARPETRGQTYELGGPGVYSFKQLLALMLRSQHTSRLLVPLPWFAARLEAAVLERLPHPLLTRDQLKMLTRDNVVAPGAEGLAALGIEPVAVEQVLGEIYA